MEATITLTIGLAGLDEDTTRDEVIEIALETIGTESDWWLRDGMTVELAAEGE